jgi:hypothetical protein
MRSMVRAFLELLVSIIKFQEGSRDCRRIGALDVVVVCGRGGLCQQYLLVTMVDFRRPKYEFVLRSKGIVGRVAGAFSGCCQQTFGSPRQFPHTSAAKICIKRWDRA